MSQLNTATQTPISPSRDDSCASLEVGGETVYFGEENAIIRGLTQDASRTDSDGDLMIGNTWSPLVLYGESGAGKSFLTQRIAACRSHDHASLLTAADIVRALHRNELVDDINQFSATQKKTSLLIIDDIHHLAKKDHADTWLCHVLDYRARRAKPTIVTCNSTIATAKLSTRLRSRLLGGLSARLVLPASATRQLIIRNALQSMDLATQPDVEQLTKLTSGKSVRGVWSYVASLALQPPPESVESASTLEISRAELIPKVVQTTARQFGVRLNDIRGPSRRKNTVLARAVAMFLLRELTDMSLAEVGRQFRHRDHTTVRHACKKVNELLLEETTTVRDTIASICQVLKVELPAQCLNASREQCA